MKVYSVEEANELLPHLAPALVELRSKWDLAVEIRSTITHSAGTNGGSAKRERWARTLARVQELLARFEAWEVIVRDIEEGLVDFPGIVDGREAYLCWKLGEPSVQYWHPPETGIAGRQRL